MMKYLQILHLILKQIDQLKKVPKNQLILT